MPELPEVQTVVNDLITGGIPNRKIIDVKVLWERSLSDLSKSDFEKKITSLKFKKIFRRAKYIVCELSDNSYLIIHLRMTGKLYLLPSEAPIQKHEHIILYLDNNLSLRFNDTRKFGKFWLVKTPESVLGNLGPEPLENLSEKDFSLSLKQNHRKLKSLLLDQTFIAGLGNIYVDEALWQAKLHPEMNSSKLSESQIKELLKAIKFVLEKGIKNRGTTLGSGADNFYSVEKKRGENAETLNVFRKEGKPCPRCNTKIIKLTVAQRGTHICPNCQSA